MSELLITIAFQLLQNPYGECNDEMSYMQHNNCMNHELNPLLNIEMNLYNY